MISVNSICKVINELRGYANEDRENLYNLFIRGNFEFGLESHLKSLATLISENNLSAYFILKIDDELVASEDIGEKLQQPCAEFEITFKKKDFIQELNSGAGDIDEVLYCSVQSFSEDLGGLGLASALETSTINNSSNTRIHVYQMDNPFGGPKLAIVPTDYIGTLGIEWLSGSKLPLSDKILKHVHIVSSASIEINPQQFELTWGQLDSELAKPFRVAFAKQLFLSLCTNYYSDDKVELKGVKHIEIKLKGNDLDINLQLLTNLSDCIAWCYEKEDPDIPLQLVIDRLSLECSSGDLMAVSAKTLEFAFGQAKSNYKFVIAKRSDEYRKELKEIYTDIQSVTDKFAEKAFSLASELLKSFLTIGFIFTVSTVSKAIVNNALLHSAEGQMLFKIAGVFLAVSFFVRWLNASADLKVSESALRSWSSKLHNHLSSNEIDELIKKQIFWSKVFYLCSLALVGMFQLHIAYLVFFSTETLEMIGL